MPGRANQPNNQLDQANTPSTVDKSESKPEELWEFIKGTTPASSIGLGMWTWHYAREEPFGPDTNWQQNLIAFNYQSFFVGTFSNTNFDQSYIVGIRRNMWAKNYGDLAMSFGYNAGVAYGYMDGDGFILSKWSPIIPVVQLFYDITFYNVGVEIGFIPGLFSIGFKIEL